MNKRPSWMNVWLFCSMILDVEAAKPGSAESGAVGERSCSVLRLGRRGSSPGFCCAAAGPVHLHGGGGGGGGGWLRPARRGGRGRVFALLPHHRLDAELPLLDDVPDVRLQGEEVLVQDVREGEAEPVRQAEDVLHVVAGGALALYHLKRGKQ